MAAQHVKDAAVAVREYKDNQGNTKKVWANVGRVMQGDDGSHFLLLDRHFNPAGVAGEGAVLVSFFDKREQASGGGQPARSAPAPGRDEIPF